MKKVLRLIFEIFGEMMNENETLKWQAEAWKKEYQETEKQREILEEELDYIRKVPASAATVSEH